MKWRGGAGDGFGRQSGSLYVRNFIIVFICLIIPTLFFCSYIFVRTMRETQEKLMNAQLIELQNGGRAMDSEIVKLNSLFSYISTLPGVKEMAGRSDIDSLYYPDWDILTTVTKSCSVIRLTNSELTDLFIYFPASNMVIDSSGFIGDLSDYQYKDSIQQYVEEWQVPSDAPALLNTQVYFNDEASGQGLTVLGKSESLYFSWRVVIFGATLSREFIENTLHQYSNQSRNQITMQRANTTGEQYCLEGTPPVAWPPKEATATLTDSGCFKDQKEQVWLFSSLLDNQLLLLSPISAPPENDYALLQTYIIFAVVLIGFAAVYVIISTLITHKLAEPITTLVSLLQDDLTEQDENRLKSVQFKEFRKISNAILTTRREKHELQSGLQERLKMLRLAQLEALRYQINPHFLFNTLEAVNWSVRERLGLVNDESMMIEKLSQFLKYSLEGGDNLVSIFQEMSATDDYISIQQYRYNHSFSVVWDIPVALLNDRMLKLSLQPIVENAISHGVCHMRTGGQIIISGQECDGSIHICIWDNGPGMTPERLREVQEQMKEETIAGSKHIGLRNVYLRHKLLFGLESGIEMSSIPKQGSKVTLKFPRLPD